MTNNTSTGFPLDIVVVFVVLSVVAIVIDLYSHRQDKTISLKNAAAWSLVWVLIAMSFASFLYVYHGAETMQLFITGYALEKVLSIDNLFVIMAIFSWFNIPNHLRHRVLYWGIIGAIIFRAIFVAMGSYFLSLGPWVEFVFAFTIAYSALMMLKSRSEKTIEKDYSQHLAYRLVKRLLPVWPKLQGNAFFLHYSEIDQPDSKTSSTQIKINKKYYTPYYATPLLLCLAIIEISDVVFAFDSVPAVIAVSREPLIVYSAMLFAILGLRTMYFVLEALKQYLVYLEKSVIILLFFISGKLIINASAHIFEHNLIISSNTSLWIVLTVLTIGIIASLVFPKEPIS